MKGRWKAMLILGLAASLLATACLEDGPVTPGAFGPLGWTEAQPETVGPNADQVADQATDAIALVGILETVHEADSFAQQGLANHDVSLIDKAISALPGDKWFREEKVAELVAQGRSAEAVQAASELRAVIHGNRGSLAVDQTEDRTYYRGLLHALNVSLAARAPNEAPAERTRLLSQWCYTLADFKREFGDQEASPYVQHPPGAC